MKNDYKLLIPAAGKGKRSGLDYPKCLHTIKGIPIIVHIINNLSPFCKEVLVIINPNDEPLFTDCFQRFKIDAKFIFQAEANGMGDAILQSADIFDKEDKVLLTWSDIPFLSKETVKTLLDCHEVFENDFSLATYCGSNCYTIVERVQGKLNAVLETKLLGLTPGDGERDIGLFVFNAEPVFKLLALNKDGNYSNGKNEHGFLYVIGELAKSNKKTEGYPIAKLQDTLSFNTPENLKELEAFVKAEDL